MNRSFRNVLWGLAPLCLVALVDTRPAAAQPFDHMTCLRVNRDLRNAVAPPPLVLNAQQTELLDSQGCKTSGSRVARAIRLCFPTNKSPSNPPGGVELSGQDFLCYRVRCDRNGGDLTDLQLTDQFGAGTVRINQRPVSKELCVPAFKPGAPTPTPTAVATPTPTPTPIVTPTPTPTPVGPTPTPPYGSPSRAFVQRVIDLLS